MFDVCVLVLLAEIFVMLVCVGWMFEQYAHMYYRMLEQWLHLCLALIMF